MEAKLRIYIVSFYSNKISKKITIIHALLV